MQFNRGSGGSVLTFLCQVEKLVCFTCSLPINEDDKDNENIPNSTISILYKVQTTWAYLVPRGQQWIGESKRRGVGDRKKKVHGGGGGHKE